jgi:PadR family transcriptional regulator, regulatory protein AphA
MEADRPLEHAVLGFLNYGPMSGYDLKKVFDASVRHFWPADQSQIYRALGRLAEEGWAEMEVIEQEDRPDRKVYHLTERGRQELSRWLAAPVEVKQARSAPLVQVFFSGQMSDAEALSIFEQAAANARALLERFGQVSRRVEDYSQVTTSPREFFFWMLTLELGVMTAQAQLEWAESVIRRIEHREVPEE